ncbi:MAG: recombinase family protein [Hyphomicrobiales bacterium]
MKRRAYIRVSTPEQRHDRQIVGLRGLCDELHIETVSAVSKSRPVYETVMRRLRPGDVFVIWDLDRAYRSTRDALDQLDRLRERDISIHIASLGLDTSTPYGVLIYTIIGALAQFERDLLSQRTKEGLEAARRNGKRIGRPPKMTKRQLQNASLRLVGGAESFDQVAADYGVASWTLARSLRREGIEVER